MKEMKIPMEKAEEIQDLYQRKHSLEDLCVLLASKNELVEEGNLFYERLVSDNLDCLNQISTFWNNIKKNCDVVLQKDEDLFLDFTTGEISVQKVKN